MHDEKYIGIPKYLWLDSVVLFDTKEHQDVAILANIS